MRDDLEREHRQGSSHTAKRKISNLAYENAHLKLDLAELESSLALERASNADLLALVERANNLETKVDAERSRQIAMGYTPESDDHVGAGVLLAWSLSYEKRGLLVEALALVRAAREVEDRIVELRRSQNMK